MRELRTSSPVVTAWSRGCAVLCAALGVAACAAQTPAGLRLSQRSLSLEAGTTTQVYALGVDTAGVATGGDVRWQSDNGAVATVSPDGLIAAVAPGSAGIWASSGARRERIAVTVAAGRSAATIVVEPRESLQTMTGWEASAWGGQLECDSAQWALLRDSVARAAAELGINRLRLTFRSNAENRRDLFADWRAGRMDFATWRVRRYLAVNDNDDPQRLDPTGFTWSELDHTVREVVLPLRQRLAARGESLYVVLTFVSFQEPGFSYRRHPEEVGELFVAAFQHLRDQFGLVPDAAEVLLEPDVARWSAEQYALAFQAATRHLAAAGFHPAIIAPSNSTPDHALRYARVMFERPGGARAVTDLSYHRYGPMSGRALASFGALAAVGGYRTMMLEHIGADHRELHADLTTGMGSAWAQYTLAACEGADNGRGYFMWNVRDPARPRLTPGRRTPFLAQYFRWVRAGAVRIGATSNRAALAPIAFTNRDGRMVVVVKADSAGGFEIMGLPAGRYRITSTTQGAALADAPEVQIADGAALRASIPAPGVITVHAR